MADDEIEAQNALPDENNEPITRPRKGGRERTGTVVRVRLKDGTLVWQGMITLPNGRRARLPPFPVGTSEAMAREKTKAKAQAVFREAPHAVAATPKNDSGEWWRKYFAHREAKGLGPIESVYRKHIAPVLAHKHPRAYTRVDCERLVTSLDAKIASTGDDQIAWKTAANAWSVFTRACKVASSAKSATGLRVRPDNPCKDVEGPERGETKSKQWLYPTEFEKLAQCETVPQQLATAVRALRVHVPAARRASGAGVVGRESRGRHDPRDEGVG